MSEQPKDAKTPARNSPILSLADPRAADPFLAGGKAAALARAAAAGLPVLPGLVLTTAANDTIDLESHSRTFEPGLIEALAASTGLDKPLVVRSSSTIEDAEESSMAGRFISMIGVTGEKEVESAVSAVLESAGSVAARAPMAVLIQPYLAAEVGGILFSVDPVSGRRDRILVSAAAGGPHRLVDGSATGARYLLTRSGRIVESDHSEEAALPRSARRALARLAAHAEQVFGGAQDIEWAMDPAGELWLLQSRPITATGRVFEVSGPVLGPGPVAETFPEPLSTLENDMWVRPLRAAIVEAMRLLHVAPRGRIKSSPILVSVGGRVAADLDLLGLHHRRTGFLPRLDPRLPARRLAAAWTAGRLRASLPRLTSDLVSEVDCRLGQIPHPSSASDAQLQAIVVGAHRMLMALNGHEVLAGMMLRGEVGGTTAASAALRALAAARRANIPEHRIPAAAPVVLALSPPAVGARSVLPSVADAPTLTDARPDPLAEAREKLRLRVRWVQELQARAAYEVGVRLAASGRLVRARDVRLLTLDELAKAVGGGDLPGNLELRALEAAGPPLPAAFRLSSDGVVVAESTGTDGGRGAGGGRGTGVVWSGAGTPPPGAVLVVRTLDPSLAGMLPSLSGLVAETGSVLSHLAILAREYGVPTVVGLEDAVGRFPAGSRVVVDGTAGTVAIVEEAAA